MRTALFGIVLPLLLGGVLTAQELLDNGGFENGLDKWRNVGGGKSATLTTVVADRFRSGAYSIRMAHPESASSAKLQIVDGLEVGALYRVSAYVYRDNPAITADISLHTNQASKGAPRTRAAASQPAKQIDAWELVECEIQTTLSGQIYVHLNTRGKGSAWFDDVSVTRMRTRDERFADLILTASSATASDDEKAAAHLDAGYILLWGARDAAAAQTHYRQALELAKPADAAKRITALVNLAECASRLSDLPEGARLLREALALDPEGRRELKGVYGGRIQAMLSVADLHRLQRDYSKAVAAYEEALPLAADSKAESRRILLNIIDACRHGRDFAHAQEAARVIIERWSTPNTPERAGDLGRTGDLLIEEADQPDLAPAAATEKFEAALRVYTEVRDRHGSKPEIAKRTKTRPFSPTEHLFLEYDNRVAMLRAAIEQRSRPPVKPPKDNADPLIFTEVFPFSNPSFEENLKDWGGNAVDNYMMSGSYARLAETGAAGGKSLALTPEPGVNNRYVPCSFTVQRGHKYYLELSIKAEGGAQGWFRLIRGASGESESRKIGADANGWQRVGESFVGTDRVDGIKDPKPDLSYIDLRLYGAGSGRVYFDDVRVYETKPYRQVLRFRLSEPAERAKLTMHTKASYPDINSVKEFFGEAGVFPGEYSPWIDIGADYRFRGSPRGTPPPVLGAAFQFRSMEDKPLERIKVEVQLASGPSEREILKTITADTPGNILGLYLPRSEAPPGEFAASFRTLFDNAKERNAHVRSLGLPPVRLKQYYLLGQFSGFGRRYTDPKILETEVDTAAQIGFSALYNLSGDYRVVAERAGIRRSFSLCRVQTDMSVDAEGGIYSRSDRSKVILRWDLIERNLVRAVSERVAALRREDPGQLPLIELIDIGDEIGGFKFTGPEYQAEFHRYLKDRGLTPADFGKPAWDEVVPVRAEGVEAANRPKDRRDAAACRHFYWSLKFWSWCTARVYRMVTAELEKQLPGVPTRVNFGPTWQNAGTDRRGTDFWEFARQRSVTSIVNEDWLNATGWRWAGIQLVAYQTDLNRSAAAQRGLGVGAMVMPDSANTDNIQLKMASAIGKGTKQLELYCYGPAYASNDSWSEKLTMVEGVARFVRKLEKAEDVLYPGQPRPAQVAMIWSQSDEIWRDSQDTLFDQMFVYLALLHDQIPVDFVDEAGIEEGRLAGYKAAYLCGRNLRRDAQRKLGEWVKEGGQLWFDGVAGAEDEYGQPCDLLDAVAGIKRQAPVRSGQDNYRPESGLSDQKPLDTIRIPSATEPVAAIGTKVPVTIAPQSAASILSTFADKAPALVESRHGQGRCRYVATLPGLAYGQTAERVPGKIETGYHETHRKLITGFALESGIERPVTCSVPMVEADLLESDRGTGLVLANYTGQPLPQLDLTVVMPVKPSAVFSSERGEIPFQYDSQTKRVQLSLPLDSVDFVVFNKKGGINR